MNSWPSTRVAQGGFFHPPKVTYSKETHELLKLLMAEQKMSILQRSNVESFLRNGKPLPKQSSFKTPSLDCRSGYDYLRARTAKKRTLAAIKASGAHDVAKYQPKPMPTESWEQKKIRLQEEMSGLKHFTAENARDKLRKRQNDVKDANQINPVDEMLQEIQERAEWLDEMEKLGEGHKYRQIIQNEISERLRFIKELEAES